MAETAVALPVHYSRVGWLRKTVRLQFTTERQ